MIDKKTIGLAGVLALIISLGVNVAQDQFNSNEYFCEDRLELGSYPCDSFSIYYGLDTGKCLNSDTGNKLCRTGWVKILNEEPVDEIIVKHNVKIIYNNRVWYCESNDFYAKCARDGTHIALYHQIIN